jgi:uncharacterized protein (DUF305 family)
MTRARAMLAVLVVGGAMVGGGTLLASMNEREQQIAQGMPGMQHPMPMPQGRPSTPPAGGNQQAVAAYQQAMDKMHRDMAIQYTGNPDRDFAAGMIPHHQGAIDMARVVLQHGSDPEIRRLAEGIIAAQEREIAFLRQWQARQAR